jgi:hypothetical protein
MDEGSGARAKKVTYSGRFVKEITLRIWNLDFTVL